MSLIKDQYYVDWRTLGAFKREQRRAVLEAMVLQVTHGADGRTMGNLLKHDPEKRKELDLLCASSLPGEWEVLSEQWQGRGRDHFFCKALYIDRGNDCVCLVSADLCEERRRAIIEDGHGEIPVESIWFSVAEWEGIGVLSGKRDAS